MTMQLHTRAIIKGYTYSPTLRHEYMSESTDMGIPFGEHTLERALEYANFRMAYKRFQLRHARVVVEFRDC